MEVPRASTLLGIVIAACLAVIAVLLLVGVGYRGRVPPRANVAPADDSIVTAVLRAAPIDEAAPSAAGVARSPITVEEAEATQDDGRFAPVPRLGRTATLESRLTTAGEPVSGTLELVAGPSRGTRLAGDDEGRILASGLYPGFHLVRVSAPGWAPFTRELVLRPHATTRFDLDLGARRTISGRVVDTRGAPIAGALVSLDGRETTTNGSGSFACALEASGDALVLVRKNGLAPLRVYLREAHQEALAEPLELVLEKGCTLEVRLRGEADGARVLLVGGGDQRRAGPHRGLATPWYLFEPIVADAGGTATVEDLPAGSVEIHALHPRARAEPVRLRLAAGRRNVAELRMRTLPRLTGRVLRDGVPVAGALVRLEAADRMRANSLALTDGASGLWRLLPIDELPSALQETRTDRAGEFILGWWGGDDLEHYLVLHSPAGEAWKSMRVERETRLEIDVADEAVGSKKP